MSRRQKNLLIYKLQRELVWVARLLLNDDSKVGVASWQDCGSAGRIRRG